MWECGFGNSLVCLGPFWVSLQSHQNRLLFSAHYFSYLPRSLLISTPPVSFHHVSAVKQLLLYLCVYIRISMAP